MLLKQWFRSKILPLSLLSVWLLNSKHCKCSTPGYAYACATGLCLFDTWTNLKEQHLACLGQAAGYSQLAQLINVIYACKVQIQHSAHIVSSVAVCGIASRVRKLYL